AGGRSPRAAGVADPARPGGDGSRALPALPRGDRGVSLPALAARAHGPGGGHRPARPGLDRLVAAETVLVRGPPVAYGDRALLLDPDGPLVRGPGVLAVAAAAGVGAGRPPAGRGGPAGAGRAGRVPDLLVALLGPGAGGGVGLAADVLRGGRPGRLRGLA